MKLNAVDLIIIQDTLIQSLKMQGWPGIGSKEGRTQVLEKLYAIFDTMQVEVLLEKPDPISVTAETGY